LSTLKRRMVIADECVVRQLGTTPPPLSLSSR
jgi:hypothetical protein